MDSLNRDKLRSLLLHKFENNLKSARVKYYYLGKKTGALLARQVKPQHACTKCKIASLHHPTTKQLLINRHDIVNAFSDYSSFLYNLASDPATPQPTDPLIQGFLASINLSITSAQLDLLSQPFTDEEILQAIRTLPPPGEDGFTIFFFINNLLI